MVLVALDRTEMVDEIASWPDEMEQLAAYARIADDTELDRLVGRVERARAK
jgi:hypothetical protein